MIVARQQPFIDRQGICCAAFSERCARDLSCSFDRNFDDLGRSAVCCFRFFLLVIQAIAGFYGFASGNCLIMQKSVFFVQIGDGRIFFFLLQQVDITIADPDIRFDRARRHERRKEVFRDSFP